MPAAVIGPIAGAVIGGGAALAASSNASDAATQAANTQAAANQAAINEQRRQFDINQQNLAPWLAAGKAALGQQGDLLGLNGTATQQSSINALQASPLYQSLFRNGQDAVLNNAAATGGLRGGNANRSLYNLGQDTLSSVIQNQLANLGAVAGSGQGSANSLNSSGSASASAIANLLSQTGAAQGSGILSSAAAGNSGLTGVGSALTKLLNNKNVLSALILALGGKDQYGLNNAFYNTDWASGAF